MKFIGRTPFFRLLIPLVSGILFYEYFPQLPLVFLLAIALTSIITVFLAFRTTTDYSKRWMFGCGIFLFVFIFAYCISFKKKESEAFSYFGKRAIFLVEIERTAIEKKRSLQFEIQIKQITGSSENLRVSAKALLYLPKDSAAYALRSGDRLLLATEFSAPNSFTTPGGFDYANYLRRKGISATSYTKKGYWRKIAIKPSFSLFRLAETARNKFLAVFKAHGILGDEFAVLAALCFGKKDEIDPDLRYSYATAGLMHVLAVSGLHVGILYGFLLILLIFLKDTLVQRVLKTLIILISLWTYAFITGLQPSVSRSSIMFSLLIIALLINRKSQIYNTVFLSAFLILCVKPELLFHVGFQLTYASVVSILYFQPKIIKIFIFKNTIFNWFWQLMAVSLAVQFGTMPLLLYYFHSFPTYFLLSNLIGVPLAILILPLALTLLLFSAVPYLSSCIAYVLNFLLNFLNFSVLKISELPYASSPFEITEFQLLFFFSAIFFAAYYFYSKKYFSILSFFAAILFFLSIHTYNRFERLRDQSLLVYSTSGDSYLSFFLGENSFRYLFSGSDSIVQLSSTAEADLDNAHSLVLRVPMRENSFFLFKNQRVLLLRNDFLKNKRVDDPIDVDLVLLTNAVKLKLEQLLGVVTPKVVVLDASISPWYAKSMSEACRENMIGFHSISQEGAYIQSIK